METINEYKEFDEVMDITSYGQIEIEVEPVKDKHIVTKEYFEEKLEDFEGKTGEHNKLDNLEYKKSGHIGFASEEIQNIIINDIKSINDEISGITLLVDSINRMVV